MSWWIYLVDDTKEPWCGYGKPASEFVPDFESDVQCSSPCYPVVSVKNHSEGGTYVMDGSAEADLNVTYNYGGEFRKAWDGVGIEEALDGKRASDVIYALRHGVKVLGTERSEDYWETTPGNAGHALSILLGWAEQHPEARFKVS